VKCTISGTTISGLTPTKLATVTTKLPTVTTTAAKLTSTTQAATAIPASLLCAIENELKPNPTFCFSFYKCVSGRWTIMLCPKFISLNITYVYDIGKFQCVPSTDTKNTTPGCAM